MSGQTQIIGLLRSLILSVAVFPLVAPGGELNAISKDVAAELKLPDLRGRQHTLHELRGRVVLVNFWASWCTPCVREMPGILRLQRAMRGQPFSILAVNVGEAESRVQAAARRLHLDFPVLLDPDGRAFKRWGGEILPTSFVVDSAGAVRYSVYGPIEWDRPDVVDRLRVLAVAALGPLQSGLPD